MAKKAVLWMHGLGDTGRGWQHLPNEIEMADQGINWQFPTAPQQPVTCNGGMRMTSWFDLDIIPISPGGKDDVEGLQKSVAAVHSMINSLEDQGFKSEDILVGGFSQGAALTLHAVLQYPRKLAGGVMLSGWVMGPEKLKEVTHEANLSTSIFWGHGEADGVVEYACQAAGVKMIADALEGERELVAKSYKGVQHSTCMEEMSDVQAFIKKVLAM